MLGLDEKYNTTLEGKIASWETKLNNLVKFDAEIVHESKHFFWQLKIVKKRV